MCHFNIKCIQHATDFVAVKQCVLYFYIHFFQYAILVLILFIAKIAAIALWFTMQGEVRSLILAPSMARKQISGYRNMHIANKIALITNIIQVEVSAIQNK